MDAGLATAMTNSAYRANPTATAGWSASRRARSIPARWKPRACRRSPRSRAIVPSATSACATGDLVTKHQDLALCRVGSGKQRQSS
jgi:hypothetical protein